MEIEIGEYSVEETNCKVQMIIKEVEYQETTKYGLIVEGIEVRPKESA